MHGMGQWVPMQDNDTAHHCVAAVAQSLNSKRHFDVQVLGNQPPDNPVIIHIENVWAWVTTQVDEKHMGSVRKRYWIRSTLPPKV